MVTFTQTELDSTGRSAGCAKIGMFAIYLRKQKRAAPSRHSLVFSDILWSRTVAETCANTTKADCLLRPPYYWLAAIVGNRFCEKTLPASTRDHVCTFRRPVSLGPGNASAKWLCTDLREASCHKDDWPATLSTVIRSALALIWSRAPHISRRCMVRSLARACLSDRIAGSLSRPTEPGTHLYKPETRSD